MQEMDKQPFKWLASGLQVDCYSLWSSYKETASGLQVDCKWTGNGLQEDCYSLWFSYKKTASRLLQQFKCRLLLQPA